MKRISRIGATALALALSVTFLTPTTALAANEKNYDAKVYAGLNQERTNNQYDDELITTDVKIIGEYDKEEDAQKAFDAAGYKPDDGYDIREGSKNNKSIYYIQQQVYKNEITGATSAKIDDVVGKNTYETKFTSTVSIKKGEVTLLTVELQNGDTTIKKVKSSKKKVVTAELDKNNTTVSETNRNLYYYIGEYSEIKKDESGNYYYYTTAGTKVIIPKDKDGNLDETSAEYKNSNGSRATIGIKLTAKKKGSSKVSFDVYNKSGVKTGHITIKVVVKDDFDVFKTFTYGGKSLIQKTYGQSNYIDNGREVDWHDNGFIDKKKGKLVVKTNPGYKIVKIEVGKLTSKSFNGVRGANYDGTYTNIDNDYLSQTASGKSTDHPIDLNGDGDFMDTVYGVSEQYAGSIFTFKKVKSGKTITLSTVGESAKGTATLNYKEQKNANGELISGKASSISQDTLAPTVIRVTYYDKANKEYKVSEKILKTFAKTKKEKKSKK